MTSIIPIVISILRCKKRFLFLKRANSPYEDLWSLVGGKIGTGEHLLEAARREVMEETGAGALSNYEYRGLVSERLVQPDGTLTTHFLIFIGHGEIDRYNESHREGSLALFTAEEINARRSDFLPSDWFMFDSFKEPHDSSNLYEAELVQDNGKYTLNYYRKAT
ncbi:MAG: NUDIX hydrolase [Candidatus Thorarchaeota archaeon]|jgi:8-oxo-dGTP pyrophosphatase MutT (NUDIX family)